MSKATLNPPELPSDLWEGYLASIALADWLMSYGANWCEWCEKPFPKGTLLDPGLSCKEPFEYHCYSCVDCLPKAIEEAERSKRLVECDLCHDGYYDPLVRRYPELAPKRCAVPWFCDQRPDPKSGLCQFHGCGKEGCKNYKHLAFGVCLDHTSIEYRVQLAAEEKRRELTQETQAKTEEREAHET